MSDVEHATKPSVAELQLKRFWTTYVPTAYFTTFKSMSRIKSLISFSLSQKESGLLDSTVKLC